MSRYSGGPAFPAGRKIEDDTPKGYTREYPANDGMTLRDWFAGQALPAVVQVIDPVATGRPEPATVARLAYEYADALLIEREK